MALAKSKKNNKGDAEATNKNYPAIHSMPWLQTAWQHWLTLAKRQGHAYLLSGPKGIGLEAFAWQVANHVVCSASADQKTQSACQQCQNCHLFKTHQHPDFFQLRRLEDKKDISVDQVRELIYKLNETSHQGGYKVIWVDGVEFLNQSAFNALLKSLEEPAAQTLFLLTTHQINRLPATIKSRCQLLSFTPPPLAEAMQWLQTQAVNADQALLKRALRLNWGAPLNALSWINAGLFAEDQQWKSDLKQCQSGNKSVSQVVATWLKWQEPERVFDYFYQWSVSAVRSVMYSTETSIEDKTKNHQVQNWLRFQQAVLTAKQIWQGNANKELVLENLCLEWLQIHQQTRPLETVFASKLQKGILA